MKTIVITGSSRGIGYALADAFLARGCQVVVSGSSAESSERAYQELVKTYTGERIHMQPCNVIEYEQVQDLWDAAVARFGKVDVWINNAGRSAEMMPVYELEPEILRGVIETNVLGLMYGARVAVSGMLAQGFGAVYNMEGMGSTGRQVPGLALYGTSKAYLPYFHTALTNEVKGTSVVVGALQPGMMITDMVMDQYAGKPDDLARVKNIFNIIADRAETVAPWLADKILANRKNGVRLHYAPGYKLFLRFLSAPFKKRDLFSNR
ncbi:MAG: SDR family oxidoreductase [Anaerolineales bacterium]|nr:SDR family oxidoreductase [Anaerolineales bacterium]